MGGGVKQQQNKMGITILVEMHIKNTMCFKSQGWYIEVKMVGKCI